MIDYIQLGGTLFVPATHKNLVPIIKREKYKELKSVVIDTEDGLGDKDFERALLSIEEMLCSFERTELLVFMRPRGLSVLEQLLSLQNIGRIDGFIFPKCSLENVDAYFECVKDTAYHIMPSIEGSELFDVRKLQLLRDKLLEHKERILLIRFGLEDMLRQLGMRRSCEDSIFDLSVCSAVLGNLLMTFKSRGFAVSGGVYPCFEDRQGFIRDVKRDLKEGLFSKTIIHPSQIGLLNTLYKVSRHEFEEAREMLQSAQNVYASDGKMIETLTMSAYSKEIVRRASVYGIIEDR